MNKEILGRIKALEAASPGRVVVLAEDNTGREFECSIDELLAHDKKVNWVTPSGMVIQASEWQFKRVVSGDNIKEIYRIIDSFDSAF